jgi:hypothetical protein
MDERLAQVWTWKKTLRNTLRHLQAHNFIVPVLMKLMKDWSCLGFGQTLVESLQVRFAGWPTPVLRTAPVALSRFVRVAKVPRHGGA